MSNLPVYWDPRSDIDHQEMAALLAPLIVSSRDRNFIDAKAAKAQTYAWRVALSNVPKEIAQKAIERLVNRGINWMPKPGEVKKECAAVVEERRAFVRQQALATCTHSSQWVDTDQGVRRCDCWLHMQRQLEAVEHPIALPPSREDRMELEP